MKTESNPLKKLLLVVAGALALAALPLAQAVPIDGTIGFAGFGGVTTGATNTVTLNPVQVSYVSGDYAGISPFFSQATFLPISFIGTGASATLMNGPVEPLWQITAGSIDYRFNLNSLSYANISSNGLNSFTLMGFGTAYMTGRDATEGNFVIGGFGSNLSFQFASGFGTANGTAVPDGGSTVALLGFALVGVAGLHRKLRSAFKTA